MKSLIFAGTTLKEDEYNLYRQLFMIIYDSLPKPDLFVYLHVDTGKLMRNIEKRGRSYEQNIKTEYLENLQKGYFEFFRQNPKIRYLLLDINELDFVANKNDYLQIRKIILETEHPTGISRKILSSE